MALLPFRIEFTERAIADLHRRIDATRWPDVGWNTGWDTGTNDAVLRDLVRYWRRDYDWFAQQRALNERPHLRGPIDGEALHAMVLAGPGSERRLPLLLIHGWPGSFVEHLDSAALLAAPAAEGGGFDVVVPSLPGFGFSDPPRAPGMHPGRIAERMHRLMLELGYERYGVQGGDWGSIIGTALALRHPEAVVGLHLNFGIAGPPPPGAMSQAEQEWRARWRGFDAEETGYSRIQGTRPQTLGYGLHDSPVGLLAWILEKFWAWTEHGDDLWDRLDRDRVLTNVMIYWLTGNILSASRIYYDMRHANEPIVTGRVTVPTAYARYPAEPWSPPREVIERMYDVTRYSEPPAGGHFAALEQPQLFAQDVAEFFTALGR